MLIGARVIQGLGGALMLPVGRLVVLRAYPRSELVRIMGFITIPGLLGPLIGPTMGGWMVEYLTWHWIFLINLPVGAVGCYAVWKFIPDLRGSERTRFDSLGFLLFGAAMVLITIAMEGLGELHLPHLRVMLLLFGGMACLAAYWLRAGHIENPLFAPSLFKTRTFAVGILGNLFARLGSGALPFLVPLLLQVALGYSPSQAGMSMLPLAAAAMVAKSVARPLIERLGYRIVLTGNTLALGLMLASMGLVSEQTPYWLLLVMLAILGAINSLAVHRDEHRDPDRPRRRQRQQRQQPAVGGRAIVPEPGRCLRRRPARRLYGRDRKRRRGHGAGRVPADLCHRRHHGDAGRDDLLAAFTQGWPTDGQPRARYRTLTCSSCRGTRLRCVSAGPPSGAASQPNAASCLGSCYDFSSGNCGRMAMGLVHCATFCFAGQSRDHHRHRF